MFEWIIILYILFVLLNAILNAAKETQKKRPITIPKTDLPIQKEEKTNAQKAVKQIRPLISVEKKIEEKREEKKIEKKEIHKERKLEESYIEKSLKNNLQEIIALIEIIGPPKAYQKWSIPYKKKD